MATAGALLLAFLLGSLPTSLWAGRHHGLDLRKEGSGNLGATNVYRVLGWRWGILVLILDVSKGILAVRWALILHEAGPVPTLAALAAVLGHMASPFARFQGGKGVATGLGVFLGLAPVAATMCFLVWASALALSGWVSVSSAVGAATLPVFVFFTRDDLGVQFPYVLGLAFAVTALVLVRHSTNWRRLAEGREQKIWERRPESPEQGALPAEEAH